MSKTVYIKLGTTDGGANDIDGIDGNSITKNDIVFMLDSTARLSSIYVATTEGASEDSPRIITPDSNSSDWNWCMFSPLTHIRESTGKNSTLLNYGVNIIRSTAKTVHSLRRPRIGCQTHIIFDTSSYVSIRLSTHPGTYGVKLNTTNVSVVKSTQTAITKKRLPYLNIAALSSAKWYTISYGPTTRSLNFTSST